MKVLIVGLGSIGKKHIDALKTCNPGIDIVALRSNLKSEPVENVSSVYSIEELIINAPFDFAIISNPTNKHLETVSLLLDFKCPLFIEKPLFHSIEFNSVLKKIADSGIKTYVACNLRFLDSIIFLKEELLSKVRINEVNIYCGSYLPDWRKDIDYRKVYSAHSDQGGGAHLDLIHELDYTYWLFGKPLHHSSFKSSRSTLGIDAVDYANYLLEYDNFAVSIILNYFRRDKKRTIELVCEDDTYTVDLFSNSVSSSKEIIFQSNQTIPDTYLRQMVYFTEIINKTLKNNTEIINNVNEAFEVLQICLGS